MSTTVALKAQTIEIDVVGDIQVTTIEQDEDVGDYVREIRVYGTSGDEVGEQVFVLRLRAPTQTALHVAVPASEM